MKSEITAIYNATDIVLGGMLSTIKTNIANTYQAHFENKINDLIDNLRNNTITDEEILVYFTNITDTKKDILYSVINKQINSIDPIKRFLLSKIWFYQIKNFELNYFYSSLLNQIDIFVVKDYELIHLLNQHMVLTVGNEEIYSTEIYDSNLIFTVSKLISNGILLDSNVIDGNFSNEKIYFRITENFEKLITLLNEYFERNGNG